MAKEKKLAICRCHWTYFVKDAILCVIFVLAAFLIAASHAFDEASLFVSIALSAIAVYLILRIMITRKTTYIALTETTIVGRKGFIKSRTLTTSLAKVQDMGLSNGLFGKIFGYHTVTISSAGSAGTEFVFHHMAKAQKFVDAVQAAIAAK